MNEVNGAFDPNGNARTLRLPGPAATAAERQPEPQDAARTWCPKECGSSTERRFLGIDSEHERASCGLL